MNELKRILQYGCRPIELIIFGGSIVYLLFFIFCPFTCPNVIYLLGNLLNSFALAYSTGYIFYFFATIFPKYKKRQQILQLLIPQFYSVNNELKILMGIIILDTNWYSLNMNELKNRTQRNNNNRMIYNETYKQSYTDINGTHWLSLQTLDVIRFNLQKIDICLDIIKSYMDYLSEDFFKFYIWYYSSACVNSIKAFSNAELSKYDQKSYVNVYFSDVLPVLMFTNDENNKLIFIDEIKNIMSITDGYIKNT